MEENILQIITIELQDKGVDCVYESFFYPRISLKQRNTKPFEHGAVFFDYDDASSNLLNFWVDISNCKDGTILMDDCICRSDSSRHYWIIDLNDPNQDIVNLVVRILDKIKI